MKYLSITIFLFYSVCSFTQSKQDYVWLLGIDQSSEPGNQAYRFDFNIQPFEVSESNNGLGFDNNNASICDEDGNLLFYTNGCAVLNKDAEVMPNGDSLNYNIWMEIFHWDNCQLGYVGTQNIMILNHPGNDELFYILHKPRIYNGSGQDAGIPLQYTLVDMLLNGGLGDVVEKNVDLFTEVNCLSSFLTAIRHINGKDWWVIQPLAEDSVFLTYLISEEGIERKEDQNTHQYFDRYRSSASGTAKFSPDGTKYALYNYYDQLHIYDFDRELGLLSNHQKIEIYDENDIDIDDIRFSSVEWSPNSRFIYTASRDNLHQVDTWEENIADGVRLIDTYNGTQDPFSTNFFLMAQGPDCRIYMCPTNGTNSYHVINHPDELGADCDFVQNGIALPLPSGAGSFPNFPRFRVDEEEKCDPTIVSVFGNTVYYRRDLEVYPNPSSGIFQIKMPEVKMDKLLVTNIYGQVLYEKDISNFRFSEKIDITNMPNGIYNIEVYPADNTERIFYSRQVVKVE